MARRPSVWNRFRLAMKVFNGGLPWNQWGSRKASPHKWPAWREDKPEWHVVDEENYIREGFNMNSLIYSAIMYKARATIAAPLRAFRGDHTHPDRVEAEHPLAGLMLKPNPFQSGAEFSQLNTVYLNVTGNCYLHLDRLKRGTFPIAIRSLRPDRVWIIPKNGGLAGFLYVPEGQSPRTQVRITDKDVIPILPEDMIHVKMPNPGDPLEGLGYGLSPLSALAYCADVDNDVTRFLKVFFQRGTMGNTVLTFDEPMDTDDIVAARARWQEVYGGFENWAEVAVLDQGGKVQRLGMTFAEMGFGEIDERSESRILGPLGVPVILLGTRIGLKRGSYDNYETARRAFWQDTLVPELNLFQAEFDASLIYPDGSFIKYDLTDVPALQQDKPRLVEAAYRLWCMGIPANIALPAMSLNFGPIPGGDIGYLPATTVPVGTTPTVPVKPVVSDTVKREVLAILDQAKMEGLHDKATLDLDKLRSELDALLSQAELEGWNADQIKSKAVTL